MNETPDSRSGSSTAPTNSESGLQQNLVVNREEYTSLLLEMQNLKDTIEIYEKALLDRELEVAPWSDFQPPQFISK